MSVTEKIILRFKQGQLLAMANFGNLSEISLPVQREVETKHSVRYDRVIFSFKFKGEYMDIDDSGRLKLGEGRYRVFEQTGSSK